MKDIKVYLDFGFDSALAVVVVVVVVVVSATTYNRSVMFPVVKQNCLNITVCTFCCCSFSHVHVHVHVHVPIKFLHPHYRGPAPE